MSPNPMYIFCLDIAFSSQALNPYPLHTALIAINTKKDYLFMYASERVSERVRNVQEIHLAVS